MSKRKLIYLHGLASSGASRTASILREFMSDFEVLSPDIPFSPKEARRFINQLAEKEKPDIVVGTSMGTLWAFRFHHCLRIIINPVFHVSRILSKRIGMNSYLAPRIDGETHFEVTPEICDAYEKIESTLFKMNMYDDITVGFFAENDDVVDGRDEFPRLGLKKIYISHSIPGEHCLETETIKNYIVIYIKGYFEEKDFEEKKSDGVMYMTDTLEFLSDRFHRQIEEL